MTIKILHGNCLDVLPTLPAESVHCVVTSPPYWNLRDYGVDGQLGNEKTPQQYIDNMVEVSREIRRVLRSDGTVWLNMGDSYVATKTGGNFSNASTLGDRQKTQPAAAKRGDKIGFGLAPKNLIGIPWRLAFALQGDGWFLRMDIIWSKKNTMPESVRDRPTKSHEYIFLLSKTEKYYYDADAIAEEVSPNTHARLAQDIENQIGTARANGGAKTNGNLKAVVKGSTKAFANAAGAKQNKSFAESVCLRVDKRNKRSVWEVASQGFKEAHFATFPPKLIEPCILAGCPEGGIVLDPFFGAGTTGLVADRLKRSCIGIELNPEYIKIAERRIKKDAGMFQSVEVQQGGTANV